MKRSNSLSQIALKCVASFLVATLSATIVQADYEEVSYEDLLNELSVKKSKVERNNTPIFDDIMIHAGVGIVTSANSAKVNNNESIRYQSGLQLSFGIDLFSPQWFSEFALRNYGLSTSGNESRSLREFDLKVHYRLQKDSRFAYRFGGGVGTRYLKINDDVAGIAIDDTTPTGVFQAGLDAYMNKNFSVGVEAGMRSALVTRTVDKTAMDISFRLDTHF